jgi:uncharacterized protein (DUF433 family)
MSVDAVKVIGELVWQDPDRVSGQSCFYGTRVPVAILFDYLEGGDTIDEFLRGYPSVSKQQALGVLKLSQQGLDELLEAA